MRHDVSMLKPDSSPPRMASFSQGFFRFAVIGCEACPSSMVSGTSLIPGIGCPFVMSSTIWLKEVGYGAGGSEGFVIDEVGSWEEGEDVKRVALEG